MVLYSISDGYFLLGLGGMGGKIRISLTTEMCPFFGSSWQGSSCFDRHAADKEQGESLRDLDSGTEYPPFGKSHNTCGSGVAGRGASP